MASYFDIFSMESENTETDIDMELLVKDEDDLIEDAGDDSEIVDMNPTEAETSHNEAASAGGIATGSNAETLEMDPVAASEAFIRRNFGLSVEDMEEVVEEKIAEAEVIPSADEEEASPATDIDESVTQINIVPAEGTVVEDPAEAISENVEVPIETESDVASVENLHRIFSQESDDEGESEAGADVEFSVTTPNNSMDFEMEGKAITIEPAGLDEGGDDDGDDVSETDEPSTEAEDTGAEEGNDVADENEEPEAGAESWRSAWMF